VETGLSYIFSVKTRDTSNSCNETDYSVPAVVTATEIKTVYPEILAGDSGDLSVDVNNDVVVTVAVNYASIDVAIKLDYLNLPEDKPINQVVPYVTSSDDDLKPYKAVSLTHSISIPARSVVTLVGQSF
jgi:hypothetical protein